MGNNLSYEMKVTMLDKSGYVVTTHHSILVFDYYTDPEKALEKLLRNHPELPVVFLTTSYTDNLSAHELKQEKHAELKHHVHNLPRYEREAIDPDADKKHLGGTKRDHQWHFNHDMFNLAQSRKRVYIMPQDVNANEIRTDVDIAWIQAGGILDKGRLPGNIQVKAYGSNEQGLSYIVTLPDGTTIFYGAAYSDWHDESDTILAKKSFDGFLTSLHRAAEDFKEINLLFYPVNPRLGNTCTEQAQLILKNIKVDYFVPTQFGQDTADACAFAYLPAGTQGICLHSPSETVKIGPDGITQVPD